MSAVLYTVDQATLAFEVGRFDIDVVCAGDSLTGWNNCGFANFWPYRTYPEFLQELCELFGWRIANGGISGEISDNGPEQVEDYLRLFPNASHFVIGFGTNDIGMWPDTEATSQRIIENLERMVQAVREGGKQSILFNVPHSNDSKLTPHVAQEQRAKRDYHNPHLKDFCTQNRIPLADICARLKNEHLGDALHPNEVGARIIAEVIFDVLCELGIDE
jgi:lysophospholipase L1-like esterase